MHTQLVHTDDAPPPTADRARLALLPALVAIAGCTAPQPSRMPMTATISPEQVIEFLHRFEALAEKEDFALISDMIDERAYFRFNDGDFIGRTAIQAAFEKTWRGDPSVKKARFYLSDITVLTVDEHTASATYTWHWEGSQTGREFRIQGRGTRVLRIDSEPWRIVHEHLSRWPRPPAPPS
jgi:ketosteroid isomerase-like protein